MSRIVNVKEDLRQMLALLEGERQALAALDLERIITCAEGKIGICERLESIAGSDLDEESIGLLDAAKRLNEINRRLRNLIATNVQSRIEMLGGSHGLYRSPSSSRGALALA